MNWQNCFELFECVWPFCGIVAEVWDRLLTQPVAIDQNANRAFLNIRKTCSNSRTKNYMTSKSCGNDVITIIYDFTFDFLIFTGSGDLWKAIFLREYNSNLRFLHLLISIILKLKTNSKNFKEKLFTSYLKLHTHFS